MMGAPSNDQCAWSSNDDGTIQTDCGDVLAYPDAEARLAHNITCHNCGKVVQPVDLPDGLNLALLSSVGNVIGPLTDIFDNFLPPARKPGRQRFGRIK